MMDLKEIVEAKLEGKFGKKKEASGLLKQIFKLYDEGGKEVIEDSIIKAKVEKIVAEIKGKAEEVENLMDEL